MNDFIYIHAPFGCLKMRNTTCADNPVLDLVSILHFCYCCRGLFLFWHMMPGKLVSTLRNTSQQRLCGNAKKLAWFHKLK